ncbi:chemotaxis protein CheB [Saccharibacillus sp. CPCC 101409]|uniref:chemotaxis protein CheB n=1 Tax=Saccharibacillus sp. CPCC 101409 TaxID=3058041 RepID=UPI002670DC14|nr:chemotaxis protein CheB [Saccharibacillus sp. CPCC 101409]MDO3410681.1 chemotaxis protein CheB [Saccharibacillus sp. CPCC 101409]
MTPYRVLVVDDSGFMRKIVSDLIERDVSFTVVDTAKNGLEAVEKIMKLKPDIVTMDVEMPEMNGLESLKIIMRQYPLPVIMLSGINEEGMRETIMALEAGAFDFIRKPSASSSQDIEAVGEALLRQLHAAVHDSAWGKQKSAAQQPKPGDPAASAASPAADSPPQETAKPPGAADPAASPARTPRPAEPRPKTDAAPPAARPRREDAASPAAPKTPAPAPATPKTGGAASVPAPRPSSTPDKKPASPAAGRPSAAPAFTPAPQTRPEPAPAPARKPAASAPKSEPAAERRPAAGTPAPVSRPLAGGDSIDQIVAVGCSTGGPRALKELLENIPASFPAPIVIVQHMPPKFTHSLAQRLNTLSPLEVVEAQHGMQLRKGTAYIAPGAYHLLIKRTGDGRYMIELSDAPPQNGHKPSVGAMFDSILPLNEVRRHAVIMTGMGSDGAKEMKKLYDSGISTTIAESEETCVVYGMPRSAAELNCVMHLLPLPQIATKLNQVVKS